MDCGSGIAAELRARDPGPLTAIVISHFHADHWFDLVPLHYAYLFGDWNTREHPELHLPPGGRDVLDSVARSWGGTVATFDDAYRDHRVRPRRAAPDRRPAADLPGHPPLHHCYAIRIESGGADAGLLGRLRPPGRPGRSSPRAPSCSSARPRCPDATADDHERGHMAPAEAAVDGCRRRSGPAAAHPRAGRERRAPRAVSDASAVFPGTVEVAHPGLRIEVGSGALRPSG